MKRRGLFYGWYIVAASALLMTYSAGVILFGFTAFMNPVVATFGWSYTQVSLAMSLRGIESGVLNPFLGVVIDRWPARRLALIGVISFGLGLFFLSKVTNLVSFYIAFLVIGLGSSLAIQMLPMTMIARWFKKNIGKASGILAVGTGTGGVFIPLLVKLIDTYGWQDALIFLAVGLWVLGIPLSFVFRNRPEEYGLLPDGEPPDNTKGSSNLGGRDFGTGVREALKMRAFWYIGITMMIQIAAINAAVIHMMPYLTSIGMDRTGAGQVAMMVALASMVARIPFGLLTDIIQKKYAMALCCVLLSVGLLFFWLIDGKSFMLTLLFAFFFGLGMGGFQPVRTPILSEYFGIRNFGVILGLTHIFVTIGSVSSPPLAGWVFDTLGSYGSIWLILGGVALLGAIVILALPPPSPSGTLKPITDRTGRLLSH